MGNPLYHPRPERWPQFSLRTFLILVTLMGAFLGWLGVQVKWIRDRHDAANHFDCIEYFAKPPDWEPIEPRIAPWSIRLFGEHGFRWVIIHEPEDTQRAQELQRLFPESEVEISLY